MIAVVVGSIAAVIVVVLFVLFVAFRLAHQKSTVQESGEMEFAVPQSLESSMSGNDWDIYMGPEMENPIAPTMDAFAFSQDEAGF
jgi:hypothetical protein